MPSCAYVELKSWINRQQVASEDEPPKSVCSFGTYKRLTQKRRQATHISGLWTKGAHENSRSDDPRPKLFVQFHLQSFRNLEDLTVKSGVMFASEDSVWVVPFG
jgi:hypothetical protein